MDTLIKKSLYSHDVYQLCLARIEKLTPQTQPQWGSMSAAQMLAHCAEILEVANGKALQNTQLIEEEGTSRKHPLFGAMSVEEKGWSMYKHLDHHLSQFGV